MSERVRGDGQAARLAACAGRALDALVPCVSALLADAAVSAEHALHVVVMNPAAERGRVAFDDAILIERSIGEPSRWEADYAHYAHAKARLAWREGVSTFDLVERRPSSLREGDLLVEGGVCRDGWIVAASGAQSWYDAAFAAMTIELCNAGLRQAVSEARSRGGTW